MTARVRTGCRTLVGLAVLAAVVPLVGCGGNKVVPVAAKVTLDGQPLPDAAVSFFRASGEEGRAAFGMTDAEGVAQLTTFEPFDGAMPGNYTVVVVKAPKDTNSFETIAASDNPADLMRMSSGAGVRRQARRYRVRTVIPTLYASAGTTPLKCSVEYGMDQPVFALSSK
ncbi:MAG: hypothetical protein AAGJ46_14770 [Planctomycetota bacterium]